MDENDPRYYDEQVIIDEWLGLDFSVFSNQAIRDVLNQMRETQLNTLSDGDGEPGKLNPNRLIAGMAQSALFLMQRAGVVQPHQQRLFLQMDQLIERTASCRMTPQERAKVMEVRSMLEAHGIKTLRISKDG